MLTKVKTQATTKTWIRPYRAVKMARIDDGALKSLRTRGYDVPLRRAKLRNKKAQLSLPWFVRLELDVVVGSDVVLCRNVAPKILDMAEVSVIGHRDVDGQPILGDVVASCKVRRDGYSIVITIKKEAQVVLGNVVWRFLNFGLTDFPGKVTLKIFETEAQDRERASASAQCLRRWPVKVLNAADAWRIGFEPFREAMENTWLTPKYARRDPRNFDRLVANYQVMIETADMQAELRRREEWSSRI